MIFFVHIKKVSIRAPESGHHGNSACHAQWAGCRPRKHDSVFENCPIQSVNCIKYTLNKSVTIKKKSQLMQSVHVGSVCECEQLHMFRIQHDGTSMVVFTGKWLDCLCNLTELAHATVGTEIITRTLKRRRITQEKWNQLISPKKPISPCGLQSYVNIL